MFIFITLILNLLFRPNTVKKKLLSLFVLICTFMVITAGNNRLFTNQQLTTRLLGEICQDSTGYIWVASQLGLNRFDGNRFVHYYQIEDDKSSLLNDYIKTITPGSGGTLWLGFINGLQKYDPSSNSFINIIVPTIDNSAFVNSIFLKKNGDLIFTTSGSGLYKLKKGSDVAEPLWGINMVAQTNYMTDVIVDRDGCYWIGTENKGVLKFNPENFSSKKLIEEIPQGEIVGLIELNNSNILIATSRGVVSYNNKKNSFLTVKFPEDDDLRIKSLAMSKDSVFYVGTNNRGLLSFDLRSLQARETEYNTGNVESVFSDKNNNLWLSDPRKGMLMISAQQSFFNYISYKILTSDDSRQLTSFLVGRNGHLWCGYSDKKIVKYDNSFNKLLEKQLNSIAVSLKDYSEDNILAATGNGMIVLNSSNGQIVSQNKNSDKNIVSVASDKEGNIFYSSYGSGFTRYNIKTGMYKTYTMGEWKSPESPSSDKIKCIYVDVKQRVWLAHYKGVDLFDTEKELFYTIDNGYLCNSIIEDANGNIWFGTNEGVRVYNPETKIFKWYKEKDGLSNKHICGMAMDSQGFVWCSTFNGISRIDHSKAEILSFYTGNGLVDRDFTELLAGYDKSSRTIYFGSDNGLTFFNPSQLVTDSLKEKVVITNLILNGKPVNINTKSGKKYVTKTIITESESFNLSYTDNSFEIELSTFDFADSDNITFEYTFDDKKNSWIQVEPSLNKIFISHINSGKYKLFIRASKNGYKSEISEFEINISPPWYKSFPAFVIYFLIIAGLISLIIYIINRRKDDALNREKQQFFVNIAHEIRSPMTLIVSPLSQMIREENLASENKDKLNVINRNVNRILSLVDQLLEISRYESGLMKLSCTKVDLVALLDDIYKTFRYNADIRNINFQYLHPSEEVMAIVDRNLIDKVFMNLLSNAFKYTPDNGDITLSLTISETPYVEIRVIDSGTGLDITETAKIFNRYYRSKSASNTLTLGFGIGLHFCKAIIDKHKGVIRAENRTDKSGSCFIVNLPLLSDVKVCEDVNSNNVRLLESNFSKQDVKIKSEYKILIVDDDTEILDYLRIELSKKYKVFIANNGRAGFDVFLNEKPDIVLTDVVMPESDGFSLVRRIKSNPDLCDIPVIIMSAKNDVSDRISGFDIGVDTYIPKPFYIDEMYVIIDNLIKKRRSLKGKYSVLDQQNNNLSDLDFKSGNEIFIEKAKTIIEKNIDNTELSVVMLASEMGLSRTQVHRKMTEITGISTGDYIRNIRLNHAAKLLKEKKMDISQIAYAVGYSNQAHFSTSFKKHFGVSPTEYIQRLANETN